MFRTRVSALAAAVVVVAAACSGSSTSAPTTTVKPTTTANTLGPGTGHTVIVGSTGTPETAVVMELYAGVLENLGFTVKTQAFNGREAEYKALESGQVDVVPASTLSLLGHLTGAPVAIAKVADQLAAIKAKLADKVAVLRPSYAESKPVIACNSTAAKEFNLEKMNDLIVNASGVVMGGPKEFIALKPFGIAGFKDLGATFKSFVTLDGAGPATVAALKGGKVDCAVLVSTDSSIKTNKFVVLLDVNDVSPADAVLPYVSKDLISDPEVSSALDAIGAKLDTVNLTALVRTIILDQTKPTDAARQWLRATGLVRH